MNESKASMKRKSSLPGALLTVAVFGLSAASFAVPSGKVPKLLEVNWSIFKSGPDDLNKAPPLKDRKEPLTVAQVKEQISSLLLKLNRSEAQTLLVDTFFREDLDVSQKIDLFSFCQAQKGLNCQVPKTRLRTIAGEPHTDPETVRKIYAAIKESPPQKDAGIVSQQTDAATRDAVPQAVAQAAKPAASKASAPPSSPTPSPSPTPAPTPAPDPKTAAPQKKPELKPAESKPNKIKVVSKDGFKKEFESLLDKCINDDKGTKHHFNDVRGKVTFKITFVDSSKYIITVTSDTLSPEKKTELETIITRYVKQHLLTSLGNGETVSASANF